MRRVCEGARITEFAFIPRFFCFFGKMADGRIAIAHRSPETLCAGRSKVECRQWLAGSIDGA
jgi:hypothetical protein